MAVQTIQAIIKVYLTTHYLVDDEQKTVIYIKQKSFELRYVCIDNNNICST